MLCRTGLKDMASEVRTFRELDTEQFACGVPDWVRFTDRLIFAGPESTSERFGQERESPLVHAAGPSSTIPHPFAGLRQIQAFKVSGSNE